MATITVNGQQVTIGEQERINAVQAAQRAGFEIPHYCWHPALSVVASCRMCLIEAGDRKPDGTVVMQPRLVPACQTPAKDGLVVISDSKKVKEAQAATLEYLLLNHPLDCPTCDQAGECFLQDYSYRYGRPVSRLQEPKITKPDKDHIGEHITLFTDRCVMCSRCVRFTREISGTAELQVINRGAHSEIDIFPGEPCDNKLAGNVVDLCPVGALCSKDFLYKQRVWWLKSKPSVCPNCSTGCSIDVDENADRIYRLQPRVNLQAQGYFMCDEGRFGFGYVHAPNRLKTPLRKRPEPGNGDSAQEPIEWSTAFSSISGELAKAAANNGNRIGLVLSPWMTCEEAFLLADYAKKLSPQTRLYLGPVPVVGVNDQYPKGPQGQPIFPVKFTIHAEKCPNRKGVAAVLQHFTGVVQGVEQLETELNADTFDVLYWVGGDPMAPVDGTLLKAMTRLDLLIVQDMLESSLTKEANYVLAGGTFAEKDGTFVNHAGLAQSFRWSIRCKDEARQDGRILMELAGRTGLYNAAVIRAEMASAIAYFAPLADAETSELGVPLEAVVTSRAPASV